MADAAILPTDFVPGMEDPPHGVCEVVCAGGLGDCAGGSSGGGICEGGYDASDEYSLESDGQTSLDSSNATVHNGSNGFNHGSRQVSGVLPDETRISGSEMSESHDGGSVNVTPSNSSMSPGENSSQNSDETPANPPPSSPSSTTSTTTSTKPSKKATAKALSKKCEQQATEKVTKHAKSLVAPLAGAYRVCNGRPYDAQEDTELTQRAKEKEERRRKQIARLSKPKPRGLPRGRERHVDYDAVHVVMFRWGRWKKGRKAGERIEDPPLPDAMRDLEDRFRRNSYQVRQVLLAEHDGSDLFTREIGRLVEGKDDKHLLIVYYAGPADASNKGCVFKSPNKMQNFGVGKGEIPYTGGKISIDFNAVFENVLCADGQKADVLALLDCPFDGPGVLREGKEVLAACGSNLERSAGRSYDRRPCFTREVAHQLDMALYSRNVWTHGLYEALVHSTRRTKSRPAPEVSRMPVFRKGCGPSRRTIHLSAPLPVRENPLVPFRFIAPRDVKEHGEEWRREQMAIQQKEIGRLEREAQEWLEKTQWEEATTDSEDSSSGATTPTETESEQALSPEEPNPKAKDSVTKFKQGTSVAKSDHPPPPSEKFPQTDAGATTTALQRDQLAGRMQMGSSSRDRDSPSRKANLNGRGWHDEGRHAKLSDLILDDSSRVPAHGNNFELPHFFTVHKTPEEVERERIEASWRGSGQSRSKIRSLFSFTRPRAEKGEAIEMRHLGGFQAPDLTLPPRAQTKARGQLMRTNGSCSPAKPKADHHRELPSPHSTSSSATSSCQNSSSESSKTTSTDLSSPCSSNEALPRRHKSLGTITRPPPSPTPHTRSLTRHPSKPTPPSTPAINPNPKQPPPNPHRKPRKPTTSPKEGIAKPRNTPSRENWALEGGFKFQEKTRQERDAQRKKGEAAPKAEAYEFRKLDLRMEQFEDVAL